MKDKTKRILNFLLRLLVTAALLWLVFSRVDLEQLGQNAKNARWQFLIVVWMLVALGFWVRAVKMRFILKRQDCDVQTLKIFGASSVTMMYSLIIPGLLSTGVKWYILKQHTGKGSNVLSSMVYNQATDIIVRLLLALVAIILTNPFGGWQAPVVCGALAFVIIFGYVLLLNKRTAAAISTAVGYALRPFPKMIRTGAEKMLEQIKVFQTAGWRFNLTVAGINLVVGLLGVAIYIYAARAAGIAVPAAALVWQSSVVYILGRLPISVANLGVREFTLIGFLAIYGIEASAALLMSMIIFSSAVFMAIIGAIYQFSWAISAKKPAP